MSEEDASNSESSGQHSLSKVEESIGEFSPLLASKPQDGVGQSAIQDETKPPKMFKSKREVVILIALSLMVFAATCCESILAPFFSPEAKSKGAGGTTIGAIFAIYPFSIFLLSPFVGKYLPIIGCRFCLLAGAFIMGGAQLLFGFVSTIESGSLFIVYCFAIRIVTAIGASMTSTAGLSILTISFKEHLAIIFSINELFIGVGYTSGPAIGGILYRVGGFHLPFTITGSILLAMIIPVFFLLPPEDSFHNTSKNGNDRDKEDEEIGSLIQTLKVPGIFVISICIVSCGTILAFFDPTLTPYLLKIDPGITSEQIGLVFFMTSFLYVVGTPIVGAICDKKISGRHLMIIGHFTTALSYFLLGPSPLFQNFLKGSVLLVEISMCFIGFCAAFFCVPLLSDMQKSGKKSGLPQTIATDTLISGIFNGCFGIGCSIGPLLGSTLVDLWGFEWTATIMALIITVEGLVLFFFTIWEKKYYSKMQGYTKIAEEA